MLIRTHSIYTPRFQRDRFGTLLITRRFIFATGKYTLAWR